jgi:CSLREA domain-containing protein
MKRSVHCICVLILVLTLTGLFRPVPVSALTTTFTVTTSTDTHDSNTSDGICYDGVDGCSLRAAIEQAFPVSYSANPVSILFWEGIAGTLNLTLGPLDWRADYVTLDGGNAITIDGSGLATGQSIFTVSGSHNTLTRLTIQNSPWDGVQMGDFSGVGAGNSNTLDQVTVVHSTAGGVYIHGGSGGADNQVIKSTIGTIPGGNICASQYANGYDGIYIDAGAARTNLAMNKIVCNGHNGIFINGTSGGAIDATTIASSYIGTDGSGAMGNGWNGIHLINATNTLIGGNNISGNNQVFSSDSRAGIWLQHSDNNSILNNSIGTNAAGTYSLANQGDGILLSDGSTGNLIGNAFNANTISGNGFYGVELEAVTLNILNNNIIGLNQDGTAAIPNAQAGVAVLGADANTIGSPDSTVNQYISGNSREGIYIMDSNLTYVGPRTVIGRGSDGVTPLGNGFQGIMLIGYTSYSSIYAGSITWNGAAGIAIIGDTAIGNTYRVGKIFANGGLAVDLGDDGHTANGMHSPPGPNNWLPYPVITAATTHSLSGSACANCRVDLYEAAGNPLANSGGGTWLASVTANASGAWTGGIPSHVLPGNVTTVACAVTTTGDCSEMSPLYSGPVLFNVFLPLIFKAP